MSNSFKSLLWLRWEYLRSSKIVLFVCALTPLIDVYLLRLLPDATSDLGLLFLGLGMVYSLTAGTFVAMYLGDEKEKNNLRTLILNGVSDIDYVASLSFIPMVLTICYALGIPLLFDIEISNWYIYLMVVIFTGLIYILINLTIGFMTKNQMQASAISMIIFFFSIFIPSLSQDMNFMKPITDFSFLGANTAYFNDPINYSLLDPTMIVLIVWNVIFSVVMIWAYQWNLKKR